MKKRVLILGGGISGLAFAWHLLKIDPTFSITLLEKTHRLGGAIETREKEGIFFELGPRTFAYDRSPHLLDLIKELGLKEELLDSSEEAKVRYLLERGKLHSFQSKIFSLLFSLLKEPFVPAYAGEETVFDFAKRRFGRKAATYLFDPLCLGIFARGAQELSVESCFPFLKSQEKQGSLLVSLIKKRLFSKKTGTLFTLKRGMGSFIEALKNQLPIDIRLNTEIERIQGQTVSTAKETFSADLIVSALPLPVLAKITEKWENPPTTSFWVVGLLAKLPPVKRGYGYLTLPEEDQTVFGMVFDSLIFPQKKSYTVLTAMVRNRGEQSWIESQAQQAALSLQLQEKPQILFSYLTQNTLPHFAPGFQGQRDSFLQKIQQEHTNLFFTGNYLEGPSVESAIFCSKKLAQKMCIN